MRLPGTLLAAAVGCSVLLTSGGTARAHDLRPGVLSMVEVDEGTYEVRFAAPVDSLGEEVEVRIELPEGCARRAGRIDCPGGLAGSLAVRGMRGDAMRTIVQLERRDGSRGEWIVSADAPAIALASPPPATWSIWIRIGIGHILGGIDHLAFVLGLLLVLGLGVRPVVDRRLLATISAFTVAHSLTLVLAVTGVVPVAIAAVEACIAASVLLVAREATHQRPTLIRRWPWLAAAVFGLVHGFGFAGALGSQGLASGSVGRSLLWFNVGVEIGQLVVVALIVSVVGLVSWLSSDRLLLGRNLNRGACYLLGGFAAWWLFERALVVAFG